MEHLAETVSWYKHALLFQALMRKLETSRLALQSHARCRSQVSPDGHACVQTKVLSNVTLEVGEDEDDQVTPYDLFGSDDECSDSNSFTPGISSAAQPKSSTATKCSQSEPVRQIPVSAGEQPPPPSSSPSVSCSRSLSRSAVQPDASQKKDHRGDCPDPIVQPPSDTAPNIKIFVNRHKCQSCERIYKSAGELEAHSCSKLSKTIQVTAASLVNTQAPVFAVKSKPPPIEESSVLDTSDEGPLDSYIKPKRKRKSKKTDSTNTSHKSEANKDGEFVCKVCGNKLGNRKSLQKHYYRLHSKNNGPDIRKCEFCQSPQQWNNMAKHQRTSKKCLKLQS